MEKDQRELELKKLEIEKLKIKLELKKLGIEKLKIKEGLFRTLTIILLTVGAGIGALIFRVYGKSFDKVLLWILGLVFFVILILALSLWLTIRKKLKEF